MMDSNVKAVMQQFTFFVVQLLDDLDIVAMVNIMEAYL